MSIQCSDELDAPTVGSQLNSFLAESLELFYALAGRAESGDEVSQSKAKKLIKSLDSLIAHVSFKQWYEWTITGIPEILLQQHEGENFQEKLQLMPKILEISNSANMCIFGESFLFSKFNRDLVLETAVAIEQCRVQPTRKLQVEQSIELSNDTTFTDTTDQLHGQSQRLFEYLSQKKRPVSYSTLREGVWENSDVQDDTIRKALNRLNTELNQIRPVAFEVTNQNKRVQLQEIQFSS